VTDFVALLSSLASAGVEFIIVGGVAAAAHGSPRTTQDVDVVYERSAANLNRLELALRPFSPYLRGAPPGLPFKLNAATLAAGLNFTLTTSLGWIDLLGEIAGAGNYRNLYPHSKPIQAFGVSCRVIDLDTLIAAKRAAGRPKDFEAISELELIRQRKLPE